MGTTWMGEFGDAGALDEVPATIAPDAFYEGAWATNVVDDTAYGVPWYVETRVLYYRTDIAEKAGITKAPTTWDELKAMAKAMKDKGGAEERHQPRAEELAGAHAVHLVERRRHRRRGRRVHPQLAGGQGGDRLLRLLLRGGPRPVQRPDGLRHHAGLHQGHAPDVLLRPVAPRD
jgi:hypothetical protein